MIGTVSHLIGGTLVSSEIIDPTGVEELVRRRDHWRLWKLLVLEFWHQEWC